MKRSRNAPSRANKRTRAPFGRTDAHSIPDEGRGPPSHPPSAADPAASDPLEPPGSGPSLLLDAPDGPEIWLLAARGTLLDLLAAAREGARRPRKRVLARAEIRRQAREAFAGASALLDEAAHALRVRHDGGSAPKAPH